MKVCHMTSVHPSTDTRIFYKECIALAKHGYDVTLVAYGNSREENDVKVVGIGNLPKSRLKRIFLFSKKIYKAALNVDADVYHLHDPELLPYVKKLKHKGKIVIFDSHENTLEQMYEKMWIPKLFRKAIGNYYKRYATKIFEKVDALISVTPHIVDMLKKINDSTYMVTNYPICDEENRTVNKSNRKVDEQVLCFTGGISREWCHETIVTCLNKLPESKYVLCGKADETYIEKLKSLKGWEQVEYLGIISKDESLKIQNSADIGMALILPSRNTDGMNGTIGNTKIFEYMMSGIPIVCTHFALWQNIIKKYKCGICVDPTNTEEIVAAIRYLKNNPDEAVRMGENGQNAVKTYFNWSTQEIVLIQIYEKMEELI